MLFIDGVRALGKGPIFTQDEVLKCLVNPNLPGSLRAIYCNILYLWIETELSKKTLHGPKLIWVTPRKKIQLLSLLIDFFFFLFVCFQQSWEDDLKEDYQVEAVDILREGAADDGSWFRKQGSVFKAFMLEFLKNRAIDISDKENNQLLLSFLNLIEKLMKHGFFTSPSNQKQLFPVLLSVLDGANDFIDPAKFTFSKYEKNEYTLPVLVLALHHLLFFNHFCLFDAHTLFVCLFLERKTANLQNLSLDYEPATGMGHCSPLAGIQEKTEVWVRHPTTSEPKPGESLATRCGEARESIPNSYAEGRNHPNLLGYSAV
jgi:hypothetical protein